MDNLYSLSVCILTLLFIHCVLCSLVTTSRAIIMNLRRTMSSSSCPRSERSKENGYKDDHNEKKSGGTSNDSSKEMQKRHKNHLSINWKDSQSSVDISRSSTPIFGKGIGAYGSKFINFTSMYISRVTIIQFMEKIKNAFILIIYRF